MRNYFNAPATLLNKGGVWSLARYSTVIFHCNRGHRALELFRCSGNASTRISVLEPSTRTISSTENATSTWNLLLEPPSIRFGSTNRVFLAWNSSLPDSVKLRENRSRPGSIKQPLSVRFLRSESNLYSRAYAWQLSIYQDISLLDR